MPVFSSDQQLYTCLKSLFSIIEEQQPDASQALLKSSLAIRFRCQQPKAIITIDARQAPVHFFFGEEPLTPIIDVGLKTDVLHCLLLGEMRLGKAIGRKQLELKGPVWKAKALEDIFHAAQEYYPMVLQDHDLLITCPDISTN